MNYSVFEEGFCEKRPGETDQEHMERIIRGAFVPSEESAGKINDMMAAKFTACDAAGQTLTLEYEVQEWMANPAGTLHGGLMATAADMTVGILARYCKMARECVTVQLSVNYLRAMKTGTRFFVHAKAEKAGKRILFMSAQIEEADTGKLAGDVTGVFM